MAGLAACNRLRGPLPTMRLCSRLSNKILHYTGERQLIHPNDVQLELSVIQRLLPHRFIACLELACAMQIWLAIHGNRAQVVVGKRQENSRILAHAWLETQAEPFFFDDRFVPFIKNTKFQQNT